MKVEPLNHVASTSKNRTTMPKINGAKYHISRPKNHNIQMAPLPILQPTILPSLSSIAGNPHHSNFRSSLDETKQAPLHHHSNGVRAVSYSSAHLNSSRDTTTKQTVESDPPIPRKRLFQLSVPAGKHLLVIRVILALIRFRCRFCPH